MVTNEHMIPLIHAIVSEDEYVEEQVIKDLPKNPYRTSGIHIPNRALKASTQMAREHIQKKDLEKQRAEQLEKVKAAAELDDDIPGEELTSGTGV
jgi:hypothetical protein